MAAKLLNGSISKGGALRVSRALLLAFNLGKPVQGIESP